MFAQVIVDIAASESQPASGEDRDAELKKYFSSAQALLYRQRMALRAIIKWQIDAAKPRESHDSDSECVIVDEVMQRSLPAKEMKRQVRLKK